MAKKTDTHSCACKGTGWIELMDDSWNQCPDHFKGQLHPQTINLLADDRVRLAEEEKKAKLQFQINQYRSRIEKYEAQLKLYQEKLRKLELELVNKTSTVRAMPAVRLDPQAYRPDADPELEITELDELDEVDLTWDELNEEPL